MSLAEGELTVRGAHPQASNLVLIADVLGAHGSRPVVYKPVAGERPLWDFPDGTLAAREVAAYEISALGGFDLVPETVLREGPLGPGMVQAWVGDCPRTAPSPVLLSPPEEVPDAHVAVLQGEDEDGDPVVVHHEDSDHLRSLAVLDAVLNNSDRKGGHVLGEDGRVYGIDHGVTLHAEPKLRTVLWGWAGDPIATPDLERLARLSAALSEPEVDDRLHELLTIAEVEALGERTEELLVRATYPRPTGDWPAVPWPPL